MSGNRAETEIRERDKGRIKQAGWSRLWDSCAKFCCPEKAEAMRNLAQSVNTSGYRPEPQRHNDVATDGLRVFSGGIKTWVCPGPASGWWSWDPHPSLQGNTAVKDWLADCVLRADAAMNAAGFYSGAHSVFEDLGLIAIGALFIDSTGESPLTCAPLSATEFVFSVDFEKRPNAVRVTYHKSAEALVKQFGRDKVPECVRADVDNQRAETMHEIIHAVVPRDDDDRRKAEEYARNPLRMAYASYWIHVSQKMVMNEGGYDEMPFVIPRWRVPTGTEGLYGVSPAMDALASARGVNLMDMLAATQVEVALNPRIKAPPGTGAIDLSPGGVTQITGSGDGPQEWLTPTSSSGILASDKFISRKEAQVLRAFHADLFEKLAPIAQKREMTNGLVDALERESLSRISPAMGRVTQEFIDPALQRIFMVLFRAGVFADPPEEAFYEDASGARYIVFPRVAQTSRMAQALNSRKVWAYRAAMERVVPLLPFKPDALDPYNLDVIHRDLDRSDGFPKEWHFTDEQVEQIKAARAEQQKAMQQMDMVSQAMKSKPIAEAGVEAMKEQAA